MTHVLIVDDERIEREAMKKIITKSFPSIEAIGEASSGLEAIHYFKTSNPELVLMDIKMPSMDGIETIKELKKLNGDTRFIMVSAFDTFEYAQQAIREGVKDYLVKPSKKDEIITTISRVINDIESEKTKKEETVQIQKKYHRALDQIKSDWVASLLLNIHHESSVLESLSLEDYQFFVALAVQLKPKDEKEWLTDSQKAVYRLIEKIIKDLNDGAIGPLMSFQIPVLLTFDDSDEKTSIKTRTTKLVRHLLKEIETRVSFLDCRIGIGIAVEEITSFSESYHQAILALEETTDKVTYLHYHPSIIRSQTGTNIDKEEKELINSIQSGDLKLFDQSFNQYFKGLTEAYHQNFDKIFDHMEELRVVLNRFLKEWQPEFTLAEQAFESYSIIQLREKAKISLMNLMVRLKKWQSENIQGIIYKSKEWIDNHFNEDITLDDVASTIQLSPYYFSKLFKENMGQTFIDYLTHKRIEVAKRLLIITKKNFKEICFDVGYHNPNYFSRVFKKITGMPPSEYRRKGLA